jgi:hypothetical protein
MKCPPSVIREKKAEPALPQNGDGERRQSPQRERSVQGTSAPAGVIGSASLPGHQAPEARMDRSFFPDFFAKGEEVLTKTLGFNCLYQLVHWYADAGLYKISVLPQGKHNDG